VSSFFTAKMTSGLPRSPRSFGESAVKDFAELFELVGDFPRLVFAGVADYL